jgi:glucan phosphoethanolaminetransferase (alkaline phosphatase superfamily)
MPLRAAEQVRELPHWLQVGCHCLFVVQFAVLDLAIRGLTFYWSRPSISGYLLASIGLMTLFLHPRLVRHGWFRAFLAVCVGGALAVNLVYFRYYHGPFDAQAALATRYAWTDVAPVLKRGAIPLSVWSIALVALEYSVIRGAMATRSGRRTLTALVTLTIGLAVSRDLHHATGEFRAAQTILKLLSTRDQKLVHGRLPLSELESTKAELPNVLFIVTESVRASDACHKSPCATSPEFDRLLPNRVTFEQARSLSSYTAVALSALATGLLQLGPRQKLSIAPDFFDLARAVRASSSHYTLAYWSSQLAGVFERGPIEQVADRVITAETLLHGPASDIEDSVAAVLDRKVADHCEQQLARLRAPRFVVLHLSGTHAPYAFDDALAPLKPWQRQVTWSGLAALHTAYLNSIIEQDHSIARCLRVFLESAQNQPWVVLYTSDHGEAFGEHSAIHHGQNLYDEQVRVPLIIAHGNGAVKELEVERLRENRQQPVTHLDLLPTLLNIMGLGNHVALQHWVTQLPGRNLLAALRPPTPMPISNCTELFPCPINTWGMLGAERKLTAQSWDGQWRCLLLEGSEREVDLAQCADLRHSACQYFPTMPNSVPDPVCARAKRSIN